jgi:hypothetical protein
MRSQFYKDFNRELVLLCAWASELESEGAKEQLINEISDTSSKKDRAEIYYKFFSTGLITEDEIEMMEKDYCSYIDFINTCIQTILLRESHRA